MDLKRHPGKKLPGMCPKCAFQGSFYEIVEAAQTGIVGQVEPTLKIQAREALWSCLFSFRVASCCCSVDGQVLNIVGNRGFSGPEKGIRARGFRACVPSVCFKVRLFLRPFGSETNVFTTALTAKHHKQVIV